MIERDIDCRKHRKSTHLASADLDVLTLEKKSLRFTILDVWYETSVDVSGNNTDGYFCKLKESKKDMVLNSGNRGQLAKFARNKGFEGAECYNIGNWKGFYIELYVDRKVKMMGKIVDGIRIMSVQPTLEKKELLPNTNEWENAIKHLKTKDGKFDNITKHYKLTKKNEKLLKESAK